MSYIPRQTILGQPSFLLRSDCVELALTEQGGQMAPVTFCADTGAPFDPYFISPWQMEGLPKEHDYSDPFRGDFLCLPFAKMPGVDAPLHGESAARKWTPVSCREEDGTHTLELALTMEHPACEVTKTVTLRDGENAVYLRHEIRGLSGSYTYSHHATLNVTPEREGVISTSPVHGGFSVGPQGNYNDFESAYTFLKGGQRIDDLTKIPSVFREPDFIDCSHVPARLHFSGAAQLFSKVLETPAWTCVWFPQQNAVWFALKDAEKQPLTHFWLEHGGRYQYPWNGRTLAVGVEDMGVCYPDDLGDRDPERAALLKEAGIPLRRTFSAETPFVLPYIQGVVPVCPDFGKVADIEFTDGAITLISETGNRAAAPVHWEFLRENA